MSIAASLAGGQQMWRQPSARRPPQRIKTRAGQFMKALIDPFQLVAVLLWGPGQLVAGVGAELRLDLDPAIGQIALYIDMIKGMGAECVPLGDARLPVWRPARVERIIAVDGFFVGQEKSGLDAVLVERLRDVVGLRLAA